MTLNRCKQHTFAKLLVATMMFFASVIPAAAEERFGLFSFQNDLFFDHDGNGYTNGFFLSKIRVASPDESGVEPPLLLKPIMAWLGMPRSTLASSTLSQIIITPRDIERRVPDPNDTPYVGELAFRSTHVYVHDEIADMMALDLGVIGPASGAAQMQRFLHRLSGATRPQGWDSQGPSKALIGIEGYRGWRNSGATFEHGRASGDIVTLAGGKLGNRESSVGGTLLVRYGTGLDRSFPTVARVVGRSGDPFSIGQSWFAYAGVSADHIVSHTGIGSSTPGNTTRLRKSQVVSVVGIAYGWAQSALSFSLQSANPLIESSHDRQSFGSISYIWRMQ